MELPAHLQMTPRLRTSRATRLLPRDVVVVRTVTILLMMMMMTMMMIIICTINCNYRIIATLYTLETWFVAGR